MTDNRPSRPQHQPRGGEKPPPGARSREAGTRIYQGSVRAFSVVLLCLGLVLIVLTVANGGGPLSVGVLMGLAFLGVGAARLWVTLRMSR